MDGITFITCIGLLMISLSALAIMIARENKK